MSSAVARTFDWFERNSGWAEPDSGTMDEWMVDGVCLSPDGCEVPPAGECPHGLVSWWLVLAAIDRPGADRPMSPERMVPHSDRLDPRRPDYVQIIEAHHEAVWAGAPGYIDQASGLFAQTARTLWERRQCCETGCRHCPYLHR